MSANPRASGFLRLRLLMLAVVGFAAVGCGSDMPHGLPTLLYFENRTPDSISILHQRDGKPEVVVVGTLAAGQVWRDYVNTLGNMADLCLGGDYVARDPSGSEIARHDDMGCESWVIASEPIPVSITNSTDASVDIDVIRRLDKGTLTVVRGLKPGATYASTVQDIGDPNDLCLGGALTAKDASGHEVGSVDLADCSKWIWDIKPPNRSTSP